MPHPFETNTGFFDKSFQEDLTSTYSLLVQLGTAGIVVVFYNQKINKYIGFDSFVFDGCANQSEIPAYLKKFVEEKPWINQNFKDVKLLIADNESTLIPLPLFDEQNADKYLEFNFGTSENSKTVFDILKNTHAANVYNISNGLNDAIKSIWPNAKVLHFTSALIETLLLNYKNLDDDKRVFVNVHPDNFNLLYIRQNKLQFSNNFSYKTKEDFIYFIIASLEQLKLNPEEARIVLMGTIDKNDTLYEMIYRYIRHSEFVTKNDAYNYSHLLDELQQHYFYVLFNTLQCE